jgi:hypothetical protein
LNEFITANRPRKARKKKEKEQQPKAQKVQSRAQALSNSHSHIHPPAASWDAFHFDHAVILAALVVANPEIS